MLQWFLPYLAWIRLGCTCVPHPESPLPPPSPSHPSGPSQCTSPEHPVSCMEPGLMIWFTYDNMHVSTRLSQSIPRSPSPAESKRLFCTSVSLLQSRIQGYHYHLSTFHIYAFVYCISVVKHFLCVCLAGPLLILVCSGYFNKTTMTGWLKQQTILSHSSGGWKDKDEGASRFYVL